VTPGLVLEVDGWTMPEDLRKPAGLPLRVTRDSGHANVSITSAYLHLAVEDEAAMSNRLLVFRKLSMTASSQH
jgi:hypothetical protein